MRPRPCAASRSTSGHLRAVAEDGRLDRLGLGEREFGELQDNPGHERAIPGERGEGLLGDRRGRGGGEHGVELVREDLGRVLAGRIDHAARTQLPGDVEVVAAAADRHDLGTGERRELHGHVPDAAEPVDPDLRARADVQLVERGAARQNSGDEAERLRHAVGVGGVGEQVLGVPAVDVFTGDAAAVAQPLAPGRAVLALLTRPPQRLHPDPVVGRERLRPRPRSRRRCR
nr:hypothetical protein [Amycolatopsis sp. FDAARGOS 1241]